MMRHKIWFIVVLLVPTLILVIGNPAHAWNKDNVYFDKEAVFCAYYRMSDEVIADQDIEELLMAMGRPTFSEFKPSEMFTRQSIRRKRMEINKTVERFSEPFL